MATLYTDAAYSPESKNFGYGYVLLFENKEYGSSGFGSNAQNCNEAEMRAVYYGLKECLEKGYIRQGSVVIIYIDCHSAIEAFTQKRVLRQTGEIFTYKMFISLVQNNDIQVKFNHVKSHCNGTTFHHKKNRECDLSAKAELRKNR